MTVEPLKLVDPLDTSVTILYVKLSPSTSDAIKLIFFAVSSFVVTVVVELAPTKDAPDTVPSWLELPVLSSRVVPDHSSKS